jgi:RNA recognition motif-containing protein
MPSNLFVTGFPYEITQDELAKIFSPCGTVTHVKILTDRDTGRSRGIGFVKMSTDAEGDAAIAKLNNTALGSRTLFVEAAKPPTTPTPREGRPTDASGFVERRSGKDRRRQPVGPWDPNDRRDNSGAAAPRPAPAGEKRWEKKPFGDKKPWEKRSFGDKKPAFGDKKPWEKKPFGDKKPGAFGDKKPWEKKPGAFGDKKPWEKKSFDEKKPGGFGGRKPLEKKPFGEGKPWEKKRPFGEKKPGGFGPKKRFFKPGGFGGKGRGTPRP